MRNNYCLERAGVVWRGVVSAILVMRKGESKGQMVMDDGLCKLMASVTVDCLSGAGLEGLTRRPSRHKQGEAARCLPEVFVTTGRLPR